MQPSKPALFKSIFSKIHPPLPLTPRESQKLQSLLTDSFRKQLDKAHSDSRNQVDRHVSAIFTNPLFSQRPGHLSYNHKDHKANPLGATAVEKLQNAIANPVDYFRDLVASGTADANLARHCMDVYMSPPKVVRLSTSLLDAEVATQGFGPLLLNWLWSSGLEKSGALFEDLPLLKNLIAILVKERNRTQVWRLLEVAASACPCAGEAKFRHRTDTVLYLVLEARRADPFRKAHKAMLTFLDGLEHLEKFWSRTDGHICVKIPKSQELITSCLVYRDRSKPIQADRYDQVVELVDGWQAAQLRVVHPSLQDPQPLWRLINSDTPIEHMARRARARLATVCIEAAELFMQAWQQEIAEAITSWLRKNSLVEGDKSCTGPQAQESHDRFMGSMEELGTSADHQEQLSIVVPG